jgi:LPS-assembly protein
LNKIFNFLFFSAFYFGSILASDIEFEADKTSFDTKNELLLLEGNISLKIENLLFKADQVSLDNKNKVFSSEKISFTSLDDFLYGQTKFVSISDNETIMKDVEFSSCPCEDKIWWVESEELKFLKNNNTLSAKKSRLKVQGRTLAYLKNVNFPISAKRKSGILLPEISINERSGLDVKIPVYLNLKENLDLTIEPRLMTQRGYGVSNQIRYLGKSYEGYFNSSFLKDDESSFKILETDDLRWSYNFFHEQKFKDSIFLNFDISSSGDPFYLSDLGSFLSGLSRTYILPQKVNLDFFSKNLKIKTDLNSFKLTNPLAKNQFQRLPGLQLNYFVNENNLNFHLDMDFAYFNKGGAFRNDDKQNLLRLNLEPEISHAYTKNNYLLKTSFSFNYSYQDFNTQSLSKFLPIINLEQSLKFFKKTERSKFFIEPFLNLVVSDQKKIINEVKVDSGLKLSSLNEKQTFGDVFLSYQKDIDIGAKFSLLGSEESKLNIKFSKLYTIGTKSLFYENLKIDFPDPFSLKIDYRANKVLNFLSKISIDNENNFSSYKNTFNFNSKDYRLSLSHNLIKNIQIFDLFETSPNKKEINSLEFTAALNFSKNWSAGFKFIHDIEEEKNVSNVFSVDYENDGLIVGIAYMKTLELDWVSILENDSFKDYHKDRIRLFFELKGLGSIGRPKENYLIRRSL